VAPCLATEAGEREPSAAEKRAMDLDAAALAESLASVYEGMEDDSQVQTYSVPRLVTHVHMREQLTALMSMQAAAFSL
jgi:hypothetical protein